MVFQEPSGQTTVTHILFIMFIFVYAWLLMNS